MTTPAVETTEVGRLLLTKLMASGDNSAEVTDAAGWTDLTGPGTRVQSVTMPRTRTVTRLEPGAGKQLGKAIPQGGGGTITINIFYDNAADDPEAIFQGYYDAGGRFAFVYQPDRAALLTGNNNALVPAASAANPQYVGSAIITNIDPWGPGGTNAKILTVTAELDDDYAIHRS